MRFDIFFHDRRNLQHQMEKIMSQLDDLKATVADNGAGITAAIAKIADLQAQLAAAIAATAPDLSPTIADLQAQVAALKAVVGP